MTLFLENTTQSYHTHLCKVAHDGLLRAASSYKVRVRSRNHLAAFIKKSYKRSDISMLELTPDFIKEYEIYLSTDAGLHNGSVWSHCMWLKTIVSKAHYNVLTPRNPFAQYRVNQNIKERQYLTEDEIKAVMTHEFADKKLAYSWLISKTYSCLQVSQHCHS